MKYEVMDVCDLRYSDNFFDIAIDKSTIDTLLTADQPFLKVAQMMKEMQRVIKTGGVYFGISFGSP